MFQKSTEMDCEGDAVLRAFMGRHKTSVHHTKMIPPIKSVLEHNQRRRREMMASPNQPADRKVRGRA